MLVVKREKHFVILALGPTVSFIFFFKICLWEDEAYAFTIFWMGDTLFTWEILVCPSLV